MSHGAVGVLARVVVVRRALGRVLGDRDVGPRDAGVLNFVPVLENWSLYGDGGRRDSSHCLF